MSVASETTQLSIPSATRKQALSTESLAFGVLFALVLTVIQRALGGVRGILFCRLMTDQELGQWSMMYSFLMTLAPLAVLGLPGAFGKFVEHYYREGQLKSFLSKISWICSGSTLVVALSMVLFPEFYSQQILGTRTNQAMMYLMAGTLIALTFLNYLTSLIEAMRQIRLATMMRFVSGVSFTVFGVLFLWVAPHGSTSAMWAFLTSSLLGAIPAIWYLKYYRTTVSDDAATPLKLQQIMLRLAPYAVWWWMSNFIHNLFELSDRYMLIHFCQGGYEVAQGLVGQYHSGRVIPLLMVGVAAMLSGLLLPYVAKAWADGDLVKARSQVNWTIKLSTMGMMAANVGLLAISPFVFNVLLEGKYDSGFAVLPMTLIYCTWFSILTVSQDFLWVIEKGKVATGAMGIGLLINILLNAILIPEYGLWGAVLGTAIGNVMALVILFSANAYYGCPPDIGCWMAVLLPMILLLPISGAIACLVVFLIGVATSRVVFSDAEKTQILELADKFSSRLRKQ